MAQVQLDLALGLEEFQRRVAAAEGMLLRLKSKTDSGFSLRAYLDTSSLQDQLRAAQKLLSASTTTIKVTTDFYKSGSQHAISASKLKRDIIDPIQRKIAEDRKYKIKIGTELAFDKDSFKQIDAIIARAKASVDAAQRGASGARKESGVSDTRKLLTQLTQVPTQGGLDAAGLRRLQNAAKEAGIKTSATAAQELRKELRVGFAKAGDEAIEGLAKGLSKKSSTVIDASNKAGQDLIKALKKSLGIASPSKKTADEVGKPAADGVGKGFVDQMPKWERQMAAAIRQAIGNAWKQGMTRDAAARGALAEMGRDAGQVISTSLGKALRQGMVSSVAPALKGALVGGAGGMATGGLVGGLGAAGAAIKQAAGPSMMAYGQSGVGQKLGMLGHGAASMVSGGANEALNTFLQNSLDSVVQAALSSGGQGALLGAAGVAGVAGATGLAKGAGGPLVNQAVESIKNRILGQAAAKATKEAGTLPQSAGSLPMQAAEAEKAYKVNLSKPQLNLLRHAVQLDNEGAGTFAEAWKELGGTLSTKMELTAKQLKLLASEVDTNPVLDDIETQADELGSSAIRVAENIKKKFAALSRELEADQIAASQGSLFSGQSKAAMVAANIGRNVAGEAAQQAQNQARLPGSTGGAIAASIENAGAVMGVLQNATGATAKALLAFAKGLAPGKLQQRIFEIVWNIDQAAGQFAAVKKDAQMLSGRIQSAWDDFTGSGSSRLLPPQPVPGTGLVREQNLQLGDVVGRTAFDFNQGKYGVRGGQIGPADIGEGRGYLEQSRRGLQSIFGKPGEWKVVEETNGVWQRIKSDSILARERLRSIARNITSSTSFNTGQLSKGSREKGLVRSRMRIWTDRDGMGTFNPFDPPFYRDSKYAGPPGRYNNQPGLSYRLNQSVRGKSTLGGVFSGSSRGIPRRPGQGPIPPQTPWRRAMQQPGALARRNVDVELFTSFKEAARLLGVVEKRLAAVGKAFDTLKVKSQVQVDQGILQLNASLQAVEQSFAKKEIGEGDAKAARYGAKRELAGLGAQAAEVQNVAQAFENLGVQSTAAYRAIQSQRNLDLEYILDQFPEDKNDKDRQSETNRIRNLATNARDAQAMEAANEAIKNAQSNSGFGGFRGREIGNEELVKAEQRSKLAINIDQLYERKGAVALTGQNKETERRVLAAYTQEIENAERALRVLNGTAKEGETITHLARNAWGTILDDFQNLVPQLLVFAVAYNLIIQRVLTTPGAVIQAAASFDRLETSISSFLSATRGIGDASGVIGELRGVALDLGIGFEKAASSYLRFAAATQGTPLEGQEVDITRTLATAGRNQGLNGEQIDRASVALTQIMSKGRVQSEELRGQLAEQLPGALQVAARAFGVTTKELYRMVEAGQIAGDEFVGRFVRQLKAEGASTNQLAGSFSNVSEQLGSSIQALAATAGQPLLDPLTVSMQGLNAIIQALIPVAPVITGLFVVLGAQALKAALNHVPLGRELIGAARGMFAAKSSAEQYTAGLGRLTGAARLAAAALKTVGRAALVGFAFEAVASTIRYAKGEVGALGDELRKVNKIAEGGKGAGLNSLQKLFGRLNIPKNISDQVTLFDAAKIGKGSDALGQKIANNQKQIQGAIQTTQQIDKALYEERQARDKAELDKDTKAVEKSVANIKTLEKYRNQVAFAVSPEDVQIQMDVNKAAEQGIEKIIERGRALGRNTSVEEKNLKIQQDKTAAFKKAAEAAGLLDQKLARVNSLGGMQARVKGLQEGLLTPDVNSEEFKQRQLQLIGAEMAANYQQMLPQERSLKVQELVLQKMSTELKAQENIQRIKLSLVESQKRIIEESLNLERTRGRLREAVAQRRVEVAGALNAPEEQLAAEVQLGRVQAANQVREVQMQAQLLNKDRERVTIETNLQKEQLKLQTQQLLIDTQMLQVERLKIAYAAKAQGVVGEQKAAFEEMIALIDQVITGTDTLVSQQGSLLQSVEARGAAELSALDIKQEELNVALRINEADRLTQAQLNQIKAAKQDIANKEAAALATIEAANAALQRQQQAIEDQLQVTRSIVDAEKERSQLAEENARVELELVDRMLELQQGRNEGGFFERISKAALLASDNEQSALDLAGRRMQIQRQIHEQQMRQKRLELNLKKQELEAEKALNDLKLKGLRIANEQAKAQLRAKLEEAQLKLEQLGVQRSPKESQNLKGIVEAREALGGNNAEIRGNSKDVEAASLVSQTGTVLAQDQLITGLEQSGEGIYSQRIASLQEQLSVEEEILKTQEMLFDLDVTRWFDQFLDKTTQLGRTLSIVSGGLSDFRQSVAQAFGDAITKGRDTTEDDSRKRDRGDAMRPPRQPSRTGALVPLRRRKEEKPSPSAATEAIGEAGQALSGKVITGIIDEMVLKPMETTLFSGLAKMFGIQQPRTAQETTATNTGETKKSVDTLNDSMVVLQDVIKTGSDDVVKAINNIAKPTLEKPVYRAPENAGMTGSSAVYPTDGSGAVKTGTPIKGALTGRKIDPDAERTGWDITVPGGVGGRISNPFSRMVITGTDFQGYGSGEHGQGYGRWVTGEAEVAGKVYELLVGHFDKVFVKRGDVLGPGATIGLQGISGHAEGAHASTHVNPKAGASVGDAWNVLEKVTRAWETGGIVASSGGSPVPVTVVNQPPVQGQASAPPSGAALPPATLSKAPFTMGGPIPSPEPASPIGGNPLPVPASPVVVNPLAGAGTGVAQSLTQLSGEATQFGQTLTDFSDQFGQLSNVFGNTYESAWDAAASMDALKITAKETPSAFANLNKTISGAVGIIGSIGLGIAGAQQMGQGGTYNTLMGLAGIFGSIGSIAGTFSKRAGGGPVTARRPYIVGEMGYELFVPETNGTIVSNDRSKALLDARKAAAGVVSQPSPGDPFAANRDALGRSAGLSNERRTERVGASGLDALSKPLDIRYQSEVINQTEYVSVDQFQRGMTEAAERGRALTFTALKNSVRARKQVGI